MQTDSPGVPARCAQRMAESDDTEDGTVQIEIAQKEETDSKQVSAKDGQHEHRKQLDLTPPHATSRHPTKRATAPRRAAHMAHTRIVQSLSGLRLRLSGSVAASTRLAWRGCAHRRWLRTRS